MKKVVKFGGSSLADAKQFMKVGDIIRADENRVFVVPSAPGKRNSKDTKVTDMLIKTYEDAKAGKDVSENLVAIKARYDEIIDGLNLKGFSLEDDFKKIAEDIKADLSLDYLASRGEFLNGKIMAEYLGYDFIDAKDVIFFNEEGQLNAYKTEKTMSKALEEHPHAVIPGFYGCGRMEKLRHSHVVVPMLQVQS